MLNRNDFRCVHRHNGFEHPVCYLHYQEEEHGLGIGYLDIETSGLQADFNMVYSWCIKYADRNKYEGYILQEGDYTSRTRDREAIRQLLIAISHFDKVVTYFGDDYKFDVPFLRTRALSWGFQFPPYKSLQHLDLYNPCKRKLKLHSYRLDSVAECLHVKTHKTRIAAEIWNRASSGYDRQALGYIWDHNRKDTVVLEEVHKVMMPYIPNTRRWL